MPAAMRRLEHELSGGADTKKHEIHEWASGHVLLTQEQTARLILEQSGHDVEAMIDEITATIQTVSWAKRLVAALGSYTHSDEPGHVVYILLPIK